MTEYRSQRLQQRLRTIDTSEGENSSTNIPSRPLSSSSRNRRSVSTTIPPPDNNLNHPSKKNPIGSNYSDSETFFNSDSEEEMEEENEEEENEPRSSTGRDRNALKRRREQVRYVPSRISRNEFYKFLPSDRSINSFHHI